MTNIDARIKIETGKYREACLSFIAYYDSKKEEISAASADFIEMQFKMMSRMQYGNYTNTPSSYTSYSKSKNFIALFDASLDGIIEVSSDDINFLNSIDNDEVDRKIKSTIAMTENFKQILDRYNTVKNEIKIDYAVPTVKFNEPAPVVAKNPIPWWLVFLVGGCAVLALIFI